MTWKALFYWLSTLGEGSWMRFRNAVASLANNEADLNKLCRSLRVYLSDMGHVDFFVDGSNRWRVRPPMLVGLCGVPGTALLCGARTPNLLTRIEQAAKQVGCHVEYKSDFGDISQVWLYGTREILNVMAKLSQIRFIANYSSKLCQMIQPISQSYNAAEPTVAPINWKVKSFCFQSFKWIEDEVFGNVHEYISRYEERYYLVSDHGNRLRAMPKREAIYAGALLQGVRIAKYDLSSQILTVPITAPLPEQVARVACLSSGRSTRIENKYLVYGDVPLSIAALLLVLAGQPHPGVYKAQINLAASWKTNYE